MEKSVQNVENPVYNVKNIDFIRKILVEISIFDLFRDEFSTGKFLKEENFYYEII